jgi:hypothetical protein
MGVSPPSSLRFYAKCALWETGHHPNRQKVAHPRAENTRREDRVGFFEVSSGPEFPGVRGLQINRPGREKREFSEHNRPARRKDSC